MLPPIFQTLKNNAEVFAIVGNGIYPHGDAPQGAQRPYVTWHIVSAVPQNELSDVPNIDNISIQVDCWHISSEGMLNLTKAVRNAIEPFAHMIAIPINERDFETKLYRITLQFDWWLDRDS